ncbi:hypothetical protein TWF696_003408 [Orbilia brochopaga]|uniref:Uncharacterized protein n=1 Tax=Orbilia brochopaga TaxID=3140254 RepID=A0AAV9TY88_9PEZI
MHTVELDLGFLVEAFQLQAARLRAQQQQQQQHQQPQQPSRSHASPASASNTSTPTTTASSSSLNSTSTAATTVTIDGTVIEVDGETGQVRVRSSTSGPSRRGSQQRRSSRYSDQQR